MWIRLKNIQVYAYHGAYDHEREHGGRFEIDVDLNADLDRAAVSDNLADTIDYALVHRMVVQVATAKKYSLIESLADTIASEVLRNFKAQEVIVRVRKPGAAVGGVLDSVEIECQKSLS
jgi:7,8-dihydroneopterin aldolase/epimerase/oxygenase